MGSGGGAADWLALTLPCLTPGCAGRMEYAAHLWGCPSCHLSYSNDTVRDYHTATVERVEHEEQERHAPEWAWRDEQARTRRLMHGGGHGSSSGGRFGGRKKPGKTRRWYEREGSG